MTVMSLLHPANMDHQKFVDSATMDSYQGVPVVKGIIKSTSVGILQQALEVPSCKKVGDSRRLRSDPWIPAQSHLEKKWPGPKAFSATLGAKIPEKNAVELGILKFQISHHLVGKYIPNSKLLPQYHCFLY